MSYFGNQMLEQQRYDEWSRMYKSAPQPIDVMFPEEQKPILLVTDASVRGASGGPAGWACTVDGVPYSGFVPYARNNQMELFAVLCGIQICPAGSEIVVKTDSKNTIQWLNGRPIKDWDIAIIRIGIRDVLDNLGSRIVRIIQAHEPDPDIKYVDELAKIQSRVAQIWNSSH